MKTYIVLNESGTMHLKNERYFVIARFMTRELHKVTSAHKRIEEIVKEKLVDRNTFYEYSKIGYQKIINR